MPLLLSRLLLLLCIFLLLLLSCSCCCLCSCCPRLCSTPAPKAVDAIPAAARCMVPLMWRQWFCLVSILLQSWIIWCLYIRASSTPDLPIFPSLSSTPLPRLIFQSFRLFSAPLPRPIFSCSVFLPRELSFPARRSCRITFP